MAEVSLGAEPIGLGSAATALFLAALWGGTPVAVSYSVDTLPPVATAAIRFTLASLFMLVWARVEGLSLRLSSEQLWPALVTGFLLFVQIGTFHVGVQLSNSSHGSLLINSFVIWVAALGHFTTQDDRLDWQKAVGLVVATVGVAVVLTTSRSYGHTEPTVFPSRHQDLPSLVGDLVLLFSSVVLAVKIVYTKFALRVIEPTKLLFWHDVVGTVLLAGWSWAFEPLNVGGFTTPAVLGLLYQGLVIAGFCFAVHTKLLERHRASQLSAFSFATPLFGVLAAWLFRGDPVSSWLWLSAACVAAGIVLVNRSNDRLQPAPQPSGS